MIRVYDDNGNVVDLVEWENKIYQKGLKEAFNKLECEEFDTCLRIEYEKSKAYKKALKDLSDLMFQKAMMENSEMQKWDSGCWIRYKLFENCVEQLKKGEE